MRAFQVGALPTPHFFDTSPACSVAPGIGTLPGMVGNGSFPAQPPLTAAASGAHPVWHQVVRQTYCGKRRQERGLTARARRSTAESGAHWGGPAGGTARPGRARGRVRGAGDRGAVAVSRLAAVAGRMPSPAVAVAGGILGSPWPPWVALAAHFAAPPPDTCVPRPRGGDDRWVLGAGGGERGMHVDPRARAVRLL